MARKPRITNQQILAAAQQVFLQQGFGGSTLEIAQLAGISEASIFKRFSTKEELFFAAMKFPETPIWMKELENLGGKGNLKENLIKICLLILEFYREMLPRFVMRRSRGSALLEPRVEPEPEFMQDVNVLASFLEQEISIGRLHSSNAKLVAHILLGTLINYVLLEQMPLSGTGLTPESVLDFNSENPVTAELLFIQGFLEVIWQGIAPKKGVGV
jgi:AcrR family transcriptional regulator